MAIFSLALGHIGKTTQKEAYTASAHIDYITEATERGKRSIKTCMELLGARMPLDPVTAMEWMDAQEDDDRKNARLVDKVRIALPVELTHEQNVALVRDYCERVTRGTVPWLAAIHDNPEAETNAQGQYNPHVHIVIRDRDLEGKRYLRTSDNIAKFRETDKFVPEFYAGNETITDYFRAHWEDVCNQHLHEAGLDARVDRRTLKEQGIDRKAQIHVGVAGEPMAGKEWEPYTKSDYLKFIDSDLTRLEANQSIIQSNLLEAQRFAEERVAAILAGQEDPRPTGPLHITQHGAWPQQWEDRQGMVAQQGEALKWVRDNEIPGEGISRGYTEIRPSRPELPPEEPAQTPQEDRQAHTEQTSRQVEKQAKDAAKEHAAGRSWTDYIHGLTDDEHHNDGDGGLEM